MNSHIWVYFCQGVLVPSEAQATFLIEFHKTIKTLYDHIRPANYRGSLSIFNIKPRGITFLILRLDGNLFGKVKEIRPILNTELKIKTLKIHRFCHKLRQPVLLFYIGKCLLVEWSGSFTVVLFHVGSFGSTSG